MFKHYFELIQDVEVFPIISLIIFLTFFIGLLFWVMSTKKTYINKMKNLPLDLEEETTLESKG